MAEKISVRYYREYNTQKRASEVRFYDDLQSAIDDPDPQLKKFVYETKPKLLGEIKLALIPIDGGSADQAVKAVLTVSAPVDQKPKKK